MLIWREMTSRRPINFEEQLALIQKEDISSVLLIMDADIERAMAGDFNLFGRMVVSVGEERRWFMRPPPKGQF